ncbi:Peptidase S54 (Rhomboid) family protein [Entamoeba marina]
MIGTTPLILLFIISLVLNPIIIISLYSLHLCSEASLVGISGFIFVLIVIELYKGPGSYTDIAYTLILNIITYMISFFLNQNISLVGHLAGIITGILYTRGFLDFIFNQKILYNLNFVFMKIFGSISLFIPLPAQPIYTETHIEILSTIKNDIIKLIQTLKQKLSNTQDSTNTLPV